MLELFLYRVTEILPLSPGMKVFRLKSTDNKKLCYKPGQWASLSVLGSDGRPADSRPYSISSSPDSDYLEFCIRMQGRFPTKLDALKVGDIVGIKGPFGSFCLDEAAPSYTFLAGGCGLAPFLSMMRWLAVHKPQAKRMLVYSCRKPEEILFRDELEDMARRDSNFKLVITITRPEPGMQWTGCTGRVNEELLRKTDQASLYYLCGPPDFAKAVRETLEKLSVPPARTISEAWG